MPGFSFPKLSPECFMLGACAMVPTHSSSLLVLVDPEDVRAALHLQEITPSFADLAELADSTKPPPELFGKE